MTSLVSVGLGILVGLICFLVAVTIGNIVFFYLAAGFFWGTAFQFILATFFFEGKRDDRFPR